MSSLVPSYKPSQRVIEMLGYLAYETVQEVSKRNMPLIM